MLSLILLFLVGLAMAFFATENTTGTAITIAQSTFRGIPLYVVVIGSMLLGIFISWLISLSNSLSSSLTLHRKDSAIRDAQTTIDRLKKENHNLQVENARLARKEHPVTEKEIRDDDSDADAEVSPLQRVKYSLKL